MVTSSGNNGNFLTDIDLMLDRETGEIVTKTVNNIEVTHNVPMDPAMTALLAPYREMAAPLANRIIGTITANITRTQNAAGESSLGDVIADAQLAAHPTQHMVAR